MPPTIAKQDQPKPKKAAEDGGVASMRSSRIVILLTVVVGISLSILLWQARNRWEDRLLHDSFMGEAQNLTSVIEREIQLFLEVLDSLGRVHSISAEVNQETFREFVRKGLLYHRRVLGVFGWAPRVPHADRAVYEDAMRRAGNAGFQILERPAGARMAVAQERSEYFPVSYVEPAGTAELPLGLDLASDTANRSALDLAATSGEITISQGIWLPAAPGNSYGRFAFSPISAGTPPSGGKRPLDGAVVAVLQPERIVREAVSLAAPKGVRVYILDRTGPHGERLIYGDTGGESPPAPSSIAHGDRRSNGIPRYERTVRSAGLSWLIICMPSAEFIAIHRTWVPWGLLVGGLLFTLLLTTHLVHLAGHAAEVEKTVRERTMELTDTNYKLTQSMAERRRLEQEVLEVSTIEKRRVGQDLHDSLGQQLTGVSLLSSALERELEDAERPETKRASRIAQLVRETIAQVRRIARGLSPVEMDAEGLADALTRLAEDTQGMFGITCTFTNPTASLVYDNIAAINLYHIAQEAVNNAARHAEPSQIEVLLEADEEGGRLVIEDDGPGISEEGKSEGGMGLKIMRYRAEMMGGKLEVTDRAGGGTRIECIFENRDPATEA